MALCPPLAQSRHRLVHRTCLLLTQSGHRAPRLVASTSASYTFRCSVGFGGRSMNFRAIGALGVSFGLALCGGLISRAEAVPVSYVFSSDASVLFSDGHLETISGAFTIDLFASTLVGVPIILDGPEPEKDLYDHFSFSGSNSITATGSEQLVIIFSGPLDGNARSLAEVSYLDFATPPQIHSVQLTGTVEPTPLPAALPLFATGTRCVGPARVEKEAEAAGFPLQWSEILQRRVSQWLGRCLVFS